MAHQQWQLPPPVISGLPSPPPTSPFMTSYPIALQTFPPAQPNGTAPTLDEDFKKRHAWKYEGYREFSKWMASDDDLFIIRRFQSLNANVILYMQDRISQIEERLEKIHQENENAEKRKNNSFRWDMKHEPERDRLMCELTTLLHHYNQYIDTFSRIRKRPEAEERQMHNLETFRRRGAVKEEEMNFANHKSDLISISEHVSTPLGRMLEATRLVRLSGIMRAKPNPQSQSTAGNTHYASDKALMNLSTNSIIILGLCMLLGPMWWLEFVASSQIRLAIISVFLGTFAVLMSLATIHQPFQVVASCAAYAAVLMVFMQIKS